jgi:acetyl/propionyl-CoA carboxylase alpha subunit/acetyl-CoA carboxylase carboxyltransferase component
MSKRVQPIRKLLIANRGEIAIRIARAASEMDIETVAIFSTDDHCSLHIKAADSAFQLSGEGAFAYLNMENIIAVAVRAGCDTVAPGYGFLSESGKFAQACIEAGLLFVGPDPDTLRLFGNKQQAKDFARELGIPVLSGSDSGDLSEALAFMGTLPQNGAVMVKAIAGGGGRGIRLVREASLLEDAITSCSKEAESAFGSGAVLIERFVPSARHIEIQVLGDGTGAVVILGDRDCTIQRRNQKIVEIAPAQRLNDNLRNCLSEAAAKLVSATNYQGLATVEFLVDLGVEATSDSAFAFLEVNPRLQVEHTITEEVTGIDLVKTSLLIASGNTLAALDLNRSISPNGVAIQLRINAETINKAGLTKPASGVLKTYHPPSGRGVRIEGYGYSGYEINPRFDSLLVKVIVHAETFSAVCRRAVRALEDFQIEGVATNKYLLLQLLKREDIDSEVVDTGWFEKILPNLSLEDCPSIRYFESNDIMVPSAVKDGPPPGSVVLQSPMTGVVVSVEISSGDQVRIGQEVGFIEALKMQHALTASVSGIVQKILVEPGQLIAEGDPLLFVLPGEVDEAIIETEETGDLDAIRQDLAELRERQGFGLDENRKEAVTRRKERGLRTARENLDSLFDIGSFSEYGALAIAAQRRRRSLEDLMRNTPADGLVAGTGTVNVEKFGPEVARCLGLAYDYTVLAGTQGYFNHRKTDRLLAIAESASLPVVFFVEGGGGRPGDVDAPGMSGLDVPTFHKFAKLSGKVLRIGIASGYCFAGNAVLFGCCDITIATRGSNIGMGGPAMIEGGGLGVFKPSEVGPAEVQWNNGVIDLLVADEAEATSRARQLLGLFQGRFDDWAVSDQRLLRQIVPENRLRVYDIRKAIRLIADTDSYIELRSGFAKGMITAFIRVEGRALGVIANDAVHLSGAIDSDGADKAARFMQMCDAFGVPILSMCDTPGFMVGPASELTGPVRHGSRMFIIGSQLSVPFFTVVLRRGYGLGAQAMSGGSFHATGFTIAWPTGEFGGMGLEGAVRLGYRKELAAINNIIERESRFKELVAQEYDYGKAVNVAQFLEIDAVIDPAETRSWISRGMSKFQRTPSGRFIDTW